MVLYYSYIFLFLFGITALTKFGILCFSDDIPDLGFLCIFAALASAFVLIYLIIVIRKANEKRRLANEKRRLEEFVHLEWEMAKMRQIKLLADNALELSPQEFFELRNYLIKSGQNQDTMYNFTGVYILFNKTKDMYYVGQAQKVFDRVNHHLTGKGNGDVYADYKYGDEFKIKMVKLEAHAPYSLNDLERRTISHYDAFSNGYNKNRGNK